MISWQINSFYVGFEVLTAVVLKSTIFWDMTPCSPLSFNGRFGGTYRIRLNMERTIPTERPPLFGEIVPIFADRGCHVVRATDSHGR
jgi:hypothetical protein